MMATKHSWSICVGALLLLTSLPAAAAVNVQCPGDTDGDMVIDNTDPEFDNDVCIHLTGADGYIKMADGKPLYMFGFSDVLHNGTTAEELTGESVIIANQLAAEFAAPTIAVDEGDELYLSLTNVGMVVRPDLFDPHTVHFHGFPNASDIFDGLPDATVSINFGATLTYYYDLVEPGTYMYHCHVEATEHMQMGMLGNLYVRPAQNKTAPGATVPGGTYVHQAGDQYVFNDLDGSTRYDVEAAIQLGSMDGAFHDASETVQPLPFADMFDNYPLLNGRGYPDTVNTTAPGLDPPEDEGGEPLNGGAISQRVHSLIEATAGERILIRLSNLNVTNFYTITAGGLPMQIVGRGARILRTAGDPSGAETNYYTTNSVTLGGGEAKEIIIDTAGIDAGTYFLYTTNLNFLSNDEEDFGGMMTEIVIN